MQDAWDESVVCQSEREKEREREKRRAKSVKKTSTLTHTHTHASETFEPLNLYVCVREAGGSKKRKAIPRSVWRVGGIVELRTQPLVTAKNILLTIYVRCMFSIFGGRGTMR